MKTISFYNRKGGTGKTSLSVLFAKYLSAAGYHVLYIDLDPQKTATNIFSRLDGIPRKVFLDNNIFNVFRKTQEGKKAITDITDRLHVIGSHFDLMLLQSTIIQNEIKDIIKSFKSYDYIIMDFGPNYNNLTMAGIYATDLLVIPTAIDTENLEQTEWTFRTAQRINTQIKCKVVINRCKAKRSKLDLEILDNFRPFFQEHLLESFIPETPLFRRYMDTGERITDTAKNKTALKSYFKSFVREVTGINKNVEVL